MSTSTELVVMDHDYAKRKIAVLTRELSNYNAGEFWREMSRIAAGATGKPGAEELAENVASLEYQVAEFQKESVARDNRAADKLATNLLGTSAEDMRGSLALMKPSDVLVVGATLLQRLEATGAGRLSHRKNTATAMRKALKQLEQVDGGTGQ